MITGHTATAGTPAGRRALSQRRAHAVQDRLVNFGVDPSRITTRGLGATQPVADDTTPSGALIPAHARQNRRVEITLTHHPHAG